jgi:iron complex outermembrane receptor protein
MNSNLSVSIAAVLGVLSGARLMAATAEGGSDALEEITVTAQRRSQSMQDVPISMQAFTGQALQQLNVRPRAR